MKRNSKHNRYFDGLGKQFGQLIKQYMKECQDDNFDHYQFFVDKHRKYTTMERKVGKTLVITFEHLPEEFWSKNDGN